MNLQSDDGRDWFFEQRFGMFIHWGLYAIPAWHEQQIWRQRLPRPPPAKISPSAPAWPSN